EQEAYALNDVLHLIELRARLLDELRAKSRETWVEEECAALAALSVPEKAIDPDAYLRLKGAKDLDRRGWAVLRELHQARETLALDPGVLFPQRLIDRLAADPPRDLAALEQVDGVRRWRVEVFGPDLLKALATA